MSRQPLVLLVSGDRLAEMTTASSLVGYGYEVLLTRTLEQAGHLLRTNRRISVLVIDTDLGQAGASLSLAKSARVSDPDLKVIYTARMPFRLKNAEKVGSVSGRALPDAPTRSADCG